MIYLHYESHSKYMHFYARNSKLDNVMHVTEAIMISCMWWCEPHNHENSRWKSYLAKRDNGRVFRGNYWNTVLLNVNYFNFFLIPKFVAWQTYELWWLISIVSISYNINVFFMSIPSECTFELAFYYKNYLFILTKI